MDSPIFIVQSQLTFNKEVESTRTVYCKNNSNERVTIEISCPDQRISCDFEFTNGFFGSTEFGAEVNAGKTLKVNVNFTPSATSTDDSTVIWFTPRRPHVWMRPQELNVIFVGEMETPQQLSEGEQERDKPTPLECSICSEAYAEDSANRTPRILKECGHTVCEKCARDLLNRSGNQKIRCPQDQKLTKVENGDIRNLPRNFAVLEVLRVTPKGIFVPCGEDPSHRAVVFCTTCLVDFCEKCFEQIHSLKVFSKHQKVPLSEKPIQLPKCPKHTYNNAEFLCRNPDCGGSTVICHTCILGAHKDHPFENLMEKLIENEKKGADLLEKLESARKNYIEKLTVTNDNLTSFSNGNKEFKQKSEEISKYFKEKEEQAIQNLKDYCADKGKHLNERMERLKEESTTIQDLIEKIDSIWKTKKDLHLIEGMEEKVIEMHELSVISEYHDPLDQAKIVWKNGTEAVFQ